LREDHYKDQARRAASHHLPDRTAVARLHNAMISRPYHQYADMA
jgi:hypothetical protein